MSAVSQKSFALGEITPSLYARSDLQRYGIALRTCRNMQVLRQGGLQNRAGTEFIGEVFNSSATVRLVPFVFNRSQAYVLEFFCLSGFGNFVPYFRPYYNGAPILLTAKNITAIPNGVDALLTINAHGYSNNDQVYISGVGGMTELNGKIYGVTVASANTIRLYELERSGFVDTTNFGVYTSGGTTEELLTVATPLSFPFVDEEGVEDYLKEFNFAQSADVMTIVHPTHIPIEIARVSETNWTATATTLAPGISAPTNITITPSAAGSGAITAKYQVTALSDSIEESLPGTSAATPAGTIPDVTNPWIVNWTAVSGAQSYNIYRSVETNGVYGLVGSSNSNSFSDTIDVQDFNQTPPINRDLFNATDDYPGAVAYHQQRILFGNSNNYPERIWGSKIGFFKNFTIRSPLIDDDSITFQIAGNEVNPIKHLIGLKRLVVMTESGEWTIEGNDAGTIVPDAINPKQHSYNGIGTLRPLIVNGTLLFVQAQGSAIRRINFTVENDGLAGDDLSVYSAHLFDGHEIVDWAYQQIPNSIMWAVRDDGVLLGFTYMPEQEMYAWHRHDFTDGLVENVCAIPDGDATALYLVVKRTIDGITRRYIEKFSTRLQSDVLDYILMDSALSYDGRNTDTAHFMNIINGSEYTHLETLRLDSNDGSIGVNYFTTDDVGNVIQLIGSTGETIRFTIETYVSARYVDGKVNRTVPVNMRFANSIVNWAKAVDEISGLDHLEGEAVSIFADGFVIASPNNPAYPTITVTDGMVTLPTPRAVIHIGLPFTSDVETLDIDTPNGETLSDKGKLITEVSMFVEKSRGMWIGAKPPSDDDVDPLEDLKEPKLRNNESYDEPTELKTEVIDVQIKGEWNSNGRVFIRQIDPLPLSILSIVPSGFVPRVG